MAAAAVAAETAGASAVDTTGAAAGGGISDWFDWVLRFPTGDGCGIRDDESGGWWRLWGEPAAGAGCVQDDCCDARVCIGNAGRYVCANALYRGDAGCGDWEPAATVPAAYRWI